MDVYLSNNAGHRACPGAVNCDPVAASGQTLTDATIGGDHTATVVAGESYAFTAGLTGGFIFGVAAVTTAANIIWACGLNDTIVMKIPQGITTLHYAGLVNNAAGYLRKLTS